MWAIKILDQYYKAKGLPLPNELVSKELNTIAREMSDEEIKTDSKMFFLPSPENWVTQREYPDLFNKKLDIAHLKKFDHK